MTINHLSSALTNNRQSYLSILDSMAAKDFSSDLDLSQSSLTRKAELMNHLANQYQNDEFEPISFVTPPRKRAKIDDASFLANNYAAFNRQPLNSLQYLDFMNNSIGGFNGFQQQQRIQGIAAGNPYVSSSLASAGVSPHLHPYNPNLSAFSQVRGATYDNLDLEAAAVSNLSERNKMFDDFEPLFPNNVQQPNDLNDNNIERCPELCASSSSLQPDDGFIIGSSESFKETNYAKAEIIAPSAELLSVTGVPTITTHQVTPSKLQRNENYSSSTGRDQGTYGGTESPKSVSSHILHRDSSTSSSRFKPFHEEKWSFHYQELVNFKKEKGDCLVPHTYPAKPHLARWVKRQRRQYKLRVEGNKNSTMTEERIKILNDIGFVWDSHEVIWNERFSQLMAYKEKVGHCRVPSYCKECPQLASWVKCQRRQYKLFWDQGKGSSMNLDRIKLLNSIGFIWEVHPGRKRKQNEQHFQHLANILMDS